MVKARSVSVESGTEKLRFPPRDPSSSSLAELFPPRSMLVLNPEPVWPDLFASIFSGNLDAWVVEPKEGVDTVQAGAHLLAIIEAPHVLLRDKEAACVTLLKEWFVSARRSKE